MEPRLIPLNAVIAMYSNTKTSWPRPFFEAGYRLEGLELPIRLADDSKVTADAIGFRRETNSFQMHESKSGANVEVAQAQRYFRASPTYLVTALSVTIESQQPLSAQTTYACLRENEERILLGLSEAKVNVPVLSVGPNDVTAVGAPIDDPVLRDLFANPVVVPGAPPGVITVDADSPDEEFDRVVFPSLVAAMAQDRENISMVALAEEALPYYAIYPAPYRGRLRKKVASAARRAAEADSQHLEYRPPTNAEPDGLIRILATPEQADPRGRTQQYQAIQGRLGGGNRRARRAEIEGQGNLFAAADLEQELDSAKPVANDDRGEEI